MSREHTLKIDGKYYDRLTTGQKTFEVRLNDRDFQAGDTILFRINGREGLHYTERFFITYVHSGLGMAEEYVVLGIERKIDPCTTMQESNKE